MSDKMVDAQAESNDSIGIDCDTESEVNDEDVPDIEDISLTKKEMMTFKVINKYYKNLDKTKINEMIDIINGKSKISLRLLDWFVTNYSDKYKIKLKKTNTTDVFDNEFNVHIGYKSQLKSYRKKYFDPFRRGQKFKYYFDKQKTTYLCTTICQLNFFKWIFSNNIIDYIKTNYNTLSKKMVVTNKMDKIKKKEKDNDTVSNNSIEKVDVKKNNINISARQKINNDEIKIVLSFD